MNQGLVFGIHNTRKTVHGGNSPKNLPINLGYKFNIRDRETHAGNEEKYGPKKIFSSKSKILVNRYIHTRYFDKDSLPSNTSANALIHCENAFI